MKLRIWAAMVVPLLAAGCVGDGELGPRVGAREIVPPQTGIYVGALYYASEPPPSGIFPPLTPPTSIESLCESTPRLAAFGLAEPEEATAADVNLLADGRFSGALSGLGTTLATVGLTGGVGDYFEYKLTNVKKYSIPDTTAEAVYQALIRNRACRDSIARRGGFAIYQVKAVYVGDIVFVRRSDRTLDASLIVRLRSVEPTIKATLNQKLNFGFTGKGQVVSFVPIVRNSSSGARVF